MKKRISKSEVRNKFKTGSFRILIYCVLGFIALQSPSFPHAFSGNPGEFFGLDPR
jgi:hypothetical protein